jgi:hydrogenase maturation protease
VTVVIGVGNELRGDDGVGVAAVRLLEGAVSGDVRLETCEGEPVALLETWAGCERAIVVDAMQSGAEPGTIRRIAAHEEPLPPELHRPSTHLLGVAEAIELARALGRLPAELVVYAVEGERFAAGESLSPSAVTAAAEVAAAIRREVA